MNRKKNEKMGIGTEYRENKLPARLLSINEVARFLGVHSSTIRRWVKKGLLESYAIGLRHSLRFKQEDILRFLSMSQDGSRGGVPPDDSLGSEGTRTDRRE